MIISIDFIIINDKKLKNWKLMKDEIKDKINDLSGQKRLEEHKLNLLNEFINSL